MAQKYNQLKKLLQELFQIDQPDLDFGLYRIMHAKSDEVTQFLDKDLLPQVESAFAHYKTADKGQIEKDLARAIEQAHALGADPEALPKVKELRHRLQNEAVNIGQLENEVYDHLFSFFRRYYSEGDFLSKRVYKPGVYAIPYEGEEVTLHWTNKDQYYIKTSEYLRDYAFRLRPEDEKNPMRVHFRLIDAAEGEHGNVKAAEGKDRVFILAKGATPADFIDEVPGPEGPELIIRFEYRPATVEDWGTGEPADRLAGDGETGRRGDGKPPKQKDLIDIARQRILALPSSHSISQSGWVSELTKPHVTTSGEKADYSRLEAHLRRYTARNTFDYFIHKDLGGFLRRELDFYIKNEVMHLDDIENETAPRVEQYLSKIKVIRKIAGKIIDFLAQLEDFQKKLWLKKKFVVGTSLLVSVRVLNDDLLQRVLTNKAQIQEWKELYGTHKIKSDLLTPGWEDEPTISFLRSYPTLVVDTSLFDDEFRTTIEDQMDNLDSRTGGVLIHSENIQAIRVIGRKYSSSIDCVHIDPPYNTATSGFLYPNAYQHSSWISMMAERLEASKNLLTKDGFIICHIDENEYERLHLLCDHLGFGDAGTMIWDKKNPMLGRKGLATQHEYVLWRTSLNSSVYLRNANQRRIIAKAAEVIAKHHGVTESAQKEFSQWISKVEGLSSGERVYKQLDNFGRVFRGVSMEAPEQRTDPKFFVPLIHPQRGKQCPVPRSGWSRTPETINDLLDEGRIIFGKDETTLPQLKVFMTDDSRRQAPSVIPDSNRGKTDVQHLGLEFPYCHPLSLYIELLGASANHKHAIVFDYFAGSGTNGHAVINLNRDEGTNRKFVLAEIGQHFDSVLIPRIKKASFCADWKNGIPQLPQDGTADLWSPEILRVIRLESYEDALNNLETRRTGTQQSLLSSPEAQGSDGLKEQYLLRYMLNVETQGSQSLLNVQAFQDPTAYKLKVKRPGSDESRDVNVDLLETFNWLIGLTVRHIAAPQTFSAAFERDTERRLRLKDRLRQEVDGPYWFRTVTGSTPDGRKALIIWRKLLSDPEQDNLVLDEWFTRQGYSSKDSEFDLIWVNGGNNLENLKTLDDRWKVRLIEEDFHRLMFDTEGLNNPRKRSSPRSKSSRQRSAKGTIPR